MTCTIIYKQGDFLEGPEKYMLHGCNRKGHMGSGAALAVKKRYPKAFKDYYDKHMQHGGSVIKSVQPDMRVVFNALTQDDYGRTKKRYFNYGYWVRVILEINHYFNNNINETRDVAMPRVGAGLANGDWEIISELLEELAIWQPVVYDLPCSTSNH